MLTVTAALAAAGRLPGKAHDVAVDELVFLARHMPIDTRGDHTELVAALHRSIVLAGNGDVTLAAVGAALPSLLADAVGTNPTA